jgi:hypothetical protein
MVESGLVKKVYFVSPEYKDEFINLEDYNDNDGERCCRADKYDDKEDKFPRWLLENSIYKLIHGSNNLQGEREDIAGFSKFVDENGTYCEIKHEKFHPNPQYKRPVGYYGKYVRVVGITQMPSSRDLPKELTNVFEKFGYKLQNIDSQDVQRLLKTSTIFL